MKYKILPVLSLFLLGCSFGLSADVLNVSTPESTLLLQATKGGQLKFLYYGDLLDAKEVKSVAETTPSRYDAYPFFGSYPQNESALSVVHPDGNLTLDMEVEGWKTVKNGNATETVITLKDRKYPVTVNVNYLTREGDNVIETWTDVTNKSDSVLKLLRFDSGYLPIRRSDVWMSQLYGTWANEGRVEEAPLPHGMKVIQNKDGGRNSHTSHAEVMFSLDGKGRENEGRVIGAALCYSGNYKLRVNTDDTDYHHFFAGINEENSSYNLQPGETFVTPALALTYSSEGLSGVSRNFHRWGRNYRLAHGDRPRKVLLNSWEGVYFDINEVGMDRMMGDIASMGGELFVMDDGWFGVKYPRNNDSSSLGDWYVDTRKLPQGLKGLLDSAKKHGVKFGIWYEPEMTNSVSELYESNPEWIVNSVGRKPVEGRGGTQLVLDMGNPEVQDHVFDMIDTLLTNYPDIDYIKWDANAPIMSLGSNYLTKDNQSHTYIEYHRGFAKVMDRIRAKYPDVTIQACASGGGRANWGVLPWFDEFWVSDNTDALQRVYMQWGTSYFFPAIAMGSHISAAPNHQTFRTIPIKYRTDVAMSGRLGMEIQPANMTEEEKDFCRNAIAQYKEIRDVVQFGDIYRLLSPYDNKGAASLMYVSPDKDEAVYYWWKTETFVGQQLPRVPMAGLNPDKHYKVLELNRIDNSPLPYEGRTFSGRYLMSNGLEMPVTHDVDYHKRNDYSSRVLRLQAVD